MKLLDMLASQNLHDQCPRLKAYKKNSSKNAQNPQKTATVGTLRVGGKQEFKNSYTSPNSTAHVHMTKVSSDDFKVMT